MIVTVGLEEKQKQSLGKVVLFSTHPYPPITPSLYSVCLPRLSQPSRFMAVLSLQKLGFFQNFLK